MIIDLIFIAALAAAFAFIFIQRSQTMTEIESLKGSIALLRTTNTEWMAFVDTFASQLKAIEAAVIARNPGDASDPDLLEKLAAAQAEVAEVKAKLSATDTKLATATAELAATGEELAGIKADVLDAATVIAEEQRRVSSNTTVADSMVQGMIKDGDPYGGALPD